MALLVNLFFFYHIANVYPSLILSRSGVRANSNASTRLISNRHSVAPCSGCIFWMP